MPIIRSIAFLIFCMVPALAAEPKTFSGPVYVEDGDTWFYGYQKRIHIRPGGIDAPEKNQVCIKDGKPWFAGIDSAKWLAEFLHGKSVTCTSDGTKSYNRWIADCTVDGKDLQDIIVRAGWAFDYPRYSKGKYAAAEAEAHAKRIGVHAGECQKPWDWRAVQKER